ncbi:MAG: hypothetical protein ACOC6A_05860 [Chloroflexota bacterium]
MKRAAFLAVAIAGIAGLVLVGCGPEPVQPPDQAPADEDGETAKPEEVRGEDPDVVPVYPQSIRVGWASVEGANKADYVAPADGEEVADFYEAEFEGLENVEQGATDKKLTIGAWDVEGQNVIVEVEYGESSKWPGYAEYMIAWGEEVG